jgi:peptide/nickel transport system permease protein
MLRFLLRRVVFGVVVMWLVATTVFIMYFIAPHDVARTLAGRQASEATIAAIRHNLGLDRPVIAQYGSFLWRAVHGDFGYSYTNAEPVTSLISNGLPVTASLVIGGAVLWLFMGVGIGVLAATRPRSVIDRTATGFSLLFYSMPTFLLGEVLLLLFFFRMHLIGIDLFPGAGYTSLLEDPVEWARHLLLPWFTIALVTAATYVRLTRGSMLDVLGEDYIRTARAKGLSRRRVIYRHGLRAGLTPVVTQFGIDVGTLLGGAIVTENVFGLPGLGELAISALSKQDLPTVIGLVLMASAFVVIANIVVDILYSVLDARVRVS